MIIEKNSFDSCLKLTQLDFYPYELIPKGNMGSHCPSAGGRRGALLRVSFDDGMTGYSDCFPWPELGDLPVETQLRDMKSGRLSELTFQSLQFARLDAQARKEGKSLFEGAKFPESHYLVTDLNLLNERMLEEISNQGFTKLKLKLGSRPQIEAHTLKSFSQQLKNLSLSLRLDFNSSLSFSQMEEFLGLLGPALDHVHSIEDPIVYDPHHWRMLQDNWGVRLAIDRLSNGPYNFLNDTQKLSVPKPFSWLEKGSFSILVIKPAISDWRELAQLAKGLEVSVSVTSYLDHPVGQLFSAWVASQLRLDEGIRFDTCGLLSHLAYEPTPFSKMLKSEKGVLEVPHTGSGVGFDSLLSALQWRRV